jgi:hypothetical protein
MDVDFYPNVTVAYRILLTVPTTVAWAERGFSKVKLLKNYLFMRSNRCDRVIFFIKVIILASRYKYIYFIFDGGGEPPRDILLVWSTLFRNNYFTC